MEPKLLHPISEALRLLSIGRTHFYTEVAAGRIRTIKSGNKTLVPQSELDRYVRERMEEAARAKKWKKQK